jgi:hypothetical protein
VPAQTILSTCELGVKKKQDFCIEVATAERNWIFWALDDDSMKSWIAAFEQSKAAGLAAKQGGPPPVAAVAEDDGGGEKKGGLLGRLVSNSRRHEDEDFISSEEEDVPAKKVISKKQPFVEQPYTTQMEVVRIGK